MAKSFKTGITADGTVSATSLAVTGEFTLPTADGSADQVLVTNGSGTVTWSNQSGGFTVSDTAPGSPSAGDLWFESDTGKTFVYYNDGSSSQWVEVGAASAAASGNDGAVQFSSGGALSSDTTNFYWDDANNRLGIGTTSPETPLNIVTTNKLGATFTGTTDGEGVRVDQSNYTSGNYVSLIESSYQDNQTAPHVRIAAQFTGSGSLLHFGTSNNYSAGVNNQAMTIDRLGNVGIGTTSPDAGLHIEGFSDVSNSSTGHFLQMGATSGANIRIDSNEINAVDNGSSATLYLQNDGGTLSIGNNTATNVGIGTNSPDYELDVRGDVEIRDTNPTLSLKDSDSTGASNGSIVFRDSADTVLGRIQMNGNDDLGIQAVGAASTMFLYAYGDWRMSLVSSGLRPYVDNSFDLGATSKRYDDVYATNGTIQTSDLRDKTDVVDIDYGLTFVNSLRPVTYRWDDRSGYTGTRTHMGFIAQEVETALGDDAATRAVWVDSPVEEYKNADTGEMEPGVERQSLRYEEMIAPMVKAIQELSALNTSQQTTISALEGRIAALEAE